MRGIYKKFLANGKYGEAFDALSVIWEEEKDYDLVLQYRKLITQMARSDKSSRELMNLVKSAWFVSAKEKFRDYLVCVEWNRPASDKFFAPRQYLDRLGIVQGYQDLADGKLDVLTISLPKRAGKALTLDTPVCTPTGFRPMGEIKAGDYVIGQDGKPTKVTDVFPQGKVPVYEVKFSDGAVVKTCGEHLWEVKWHDTSKRGGEQQYFTKIMSTKEIYDTPLKAKTHNLYAIRYTEPVEFEKKDLPLHPYIMGALIGDGCLRDQTPMLTSFDAETVERIAKYLPETDEIYCQDEKRGRYLIRHKNGLKNGGHKHSGTCEALLKYGLIGKLSYYKDIPKDYMYSSAEDRWELLCGLLDTDGCCDEKHIEFSTVSFVLARQVQFLVRSLGGSSNIHSRMCKYKKKDGTTVTTCTNYRVSAQFPKGFKPFHIARKHDRYEPKREQLYHYIESITPIGEDYAQCICVDNADHLYLATEWFVPTHNSQTEINFVDFLSGRNPNRSSLIEGSGDALVESFYRGCMEYLDKDSAYSYYDIFPTAKVVQTNAKMHTFNLVEESRFPTVMCRSIDATQVGLSEATNVLVLDDCIEGREEALNRNRLDAKWEIISGDVMGRALEGTPWVLSGTRYSMHDIIGRTIEMANDNGLRVRSIAYPALNLETDESNYEYYNPKLERKIFTTDFFRQQRKALSAEQWESEFQQQPFEAKGLLFPEDDLNRFIELPADRDPDSIMAVCDTAEGKGDSVSMPIGYIYGEDVYIVDVVFDNSTPEHTKPQCASKIVEHKVGQVTFESNSAGTYYARDVDQLVKELGGRCNIRSKRTISNKETRIEMASAGILHNFFFLDKSKYESNSQYGKFMKELITYTRLGKVKHDDAPDSLGLFENELRTVLIPTIEIKKRFW